VYKAPGGALGGGAGALAMTGADVMWWIALGIAMLIAGVLLLHATRRRHRTVGTDGPV
jgi:LPXTG-motif cell wall-anchored protein